MTNQVPSNQKSPFCPRTITSSLFARVNLRDENKNKRGHSLNFGKILMINRENF